MKQNRKLKWEREQNLFVIVFIIFVVVVVVVVFIIVVIDEIVVFVLPDSAVGVAVEGRGLFAGL